MTVLYDWHLSMEMQQIWLKILTFCVLDCMAYVLWLMSYFLCFMSYDSCLVFYVLCLMFYVPFPMMYVLCLISYVLFPMTYAFNLTLVIYFVDMNDFVVYLFVVLCNVLFCFSIIPTLLFFVFKTCHAFA